MKSESSRGQCAVLGQGFVSGDSTMVLWLCAVPPLSISTVREMDEGCCTIDNDTESKV